MRTCFWDAQTRVSAWHALDSVSSNHLSLLSAGCFATLCNHFENCCNSEGCNVTPLLHYCYATVAIIFAVFDHVKLATILFFGIIHKNDVYKSITEVTNCNISKKFPPVLHLSGDLFVHFAVFVWIIYTNPKKPIMTRFLICCFKKWHCVDSSKLVI